METPRLEHLTADEFDYVYNPAEDTFLLLDALEKDLCHIQTVKPSLCLEVGSGSGAVITALSKMLGSRAFCIASDINPYACKASRSTAKENDAAVALINMDLVSTINERNQFDIIIFNPPYHPTESQEMNASDSTLISSELYKTWAGGKKGREVMDRLFPYIKSILSPKGVFYLVTVKENKIEEIQEIFKLQQFKMTLVLDRKVRGEHLHVLRFNR